MEQGQDEPKRDGGGFEDIPEEAHLRDIHAQPDYQPDVERVSGCGQSPQFEQASEISQHQPPEILENKGNMKGPQSPQGQKGGRDRCQSRRADHSVGVIAVGIGGNLGRTGEHKQGNALSQ